MDSDPKLRSEFRRALDVVTPPAPWLRTRVNDTLRQERTRSSRVGLRRPVIALRLPGFSQKLAAVALIVVLAAAAVEVFLVTHRQANLSGPAGPAQPQAMRSGTEVLNAGTYVFRPLFDTSGKPFPNVLITVPAGWSSYGGFAVQRSTGTPRELAVSVWNVGDVYANGCHWLGPTIHPGASVDELAAVLAARPLRNATAPVPVSFGGYQGKYLEWSVPADIQFQQALGEQGFSDCDGGMFKSWTDAQGGERYQQGPGQVDQLWILDVGGQRLVIDATYMPGATVQDRAQLAQLVKSIAFKR